ncbi:uncharacterized protein FTJAE_11681 [Fusarium tjaetaba]|uniref:Uncharacterized protein n=1 Tax=Fusarium tjaetaba TaxID=1567544 RepID=A0A8H5QT05_9HYPO|nr:uncharacterized protein FTJAE_11681 [Fusarium tjaetaba]KAF5620324.1 hypothetical protein FTJAE_11681 [Fusarium tjaetaba]
MPRTSEEHPTLSRNDPQAMSSDFLYEVNERLIEWLKQDATNYDKEPSEYVTFYEEEEEPEHKSYNRFGRMARRLKKWFTDHYHHEV